MRGPSPNQRDHQAASYCDHSTYLNRWPLIGQALRCLKPEPSSSRGRPLSHNHLQVEAAQERLPEPVDIGGISCSARGRGGVGFVAVLSGGGRMRVHIR